MKESNVEIRCGDGTMPAFVSVPEGVASCPGIIVYMDVFGPREELYDICRHFTACGYAAILPQLFYRLGSPVFAPANRRSDAVDPLAQEANAATTIDMTMRDVTAIVDFLDRGGVGIPVGRLGTIGYCMGGRHALAAAVAAPQAIAAAVSAHGGRLVTDAADSPHLLLERIQVETYLAFAHDDETCPEPHQQLLERTAAAVGSHIRCERLAAHHGWSFVERWCFDRKASDRVWEHSLQMFRRTLWTPHEPVMRG
jgi:carboxymethylenebutenolidase